MIVLALSHCLAFTYAHQAAYGYGCDYSEGFIDE